MTKFKGYLDHLRENLEVLDEQIANARKMSKGKKAGDKKVALQYAKTLRDLVELRNATLASIKIHLLGRDETGSPNEPSDIWEEGNDQIEFERYFHNLVSPWTRGDLKMTCDDCGKKSEDVTRRYLPDPDVNNPGRHADLCDSCYKKNRIEPDQEEEE